MTPGIARRPLVGLCMAVLCAIIVTSCGGSPTKTPHSDPATPEVLSGIRFSDQFQVPEGLSVVCMGGETEPAFGIPSICEVMVWDGLTYWALSFVDNRFAMAILAVAPDGEILQRWDRDGARYLWKIVLDDVEATATFVGQFEQAFTVDWEDLIVQD